MSDSNKKELLKVKLKEGNFNESEIEAIAGKLKQGLKNKYGSGNVKGGVSSSNKIKFKLKKEASSENVTAAWFS
ncbi:MAG: hypothetical protein AB2651_20880 [Candidatus Thiodiazotropha sp.]